MKNIFKILLFSSLLFVSCDDKLIEPYTPGALTEDLAIQTSANLRTLMNTAYADLFDRTESVFTSVFTDEAGIGYANGGQGVTDDYIFFMNSSSDSPNSIWVSNYFALSIANRVIVFADRITAVDAADAEAIARLKAEALTVRALCHLKILSYFSPDPKNDNALAGVLSDRIIATSETNLLRSTNGVFYTSIHNDLNSSISIFNSLTSSPFSGIAKTYYANANLSKALKARAYALKGDYTNAEIWADDVINNSGISLANASNYNSVFFTDSEPADTEVIFRVKRTAAQNSQATNLHNGWCSVRPNLSGSPFYEVGRSLFNLLNQNPLDIRRKTIVAPSSVIDANYATSTNYIATDKLIIHKHGGVATGTTTAATTTSNQFNNDLKIVRISEMYMIKAEARVAAGDLAGAANTIDILRDKRFVANQTTPVYTDVTDAWRAILTERRIEFAFEGYRYIDMKRLGALANVTLDRDAADYSSSSSNYPAGNPVNLPLSSYKWAMPIPTDELNANSGIQQNPGY